MTVAISGVPPSPLSRQVYRLLWSSLVLSYLTFIPALVPDLGRSSIEIIPGTCGFAIAHSITFLVLLLKHHNRVLRSDDEIRSDGEMNPLADSPPPTATLGNIICTWLLCASFASGFGVELAVLIVSVQYTLDYEPTSIILTLILVAAEMGVLFTLAIKSTKERRKVAGRSAKWWYRLQDQKQRDRKVVKNGVLDSKHNHLISTP